METTLLGRLAAYVLTRVGHRPLACSLPSLRARSRCVSRIIVSCAVLTAALARAEDRVDLRFNYFVEPAAKQRLHVFTPQLAIQVDAHRALTFRVAYDADVVSG